MLFKANFVKWKLNTTVILNGEREAVNFNEENFGHIYRFINKLPFLNQNKKEGVTLHLNGTETQYIAVAEEFLFPELIQTIQKPHAKMNWS